MSDKSWMLNAQAISAAKRCINAVQQELDIRLTLSHPEFVTLLIEYADLTGSKEINAALIELGQFMPPDVQSQLSPLATKFKPGSPSLIVNTRPTATAQKNEMITVKGKSYPRYKDGEEFKGLYRGQPRYG